MCAWRRVAIAIVLMSAGLRAQAPVGIDRPIPPPADVAAPGADATQTTTLMYWKILRRGSGTQHPQGADRVTVQYTIWTPDGKTFDSSQYRKKPSVFSLDTMVMTGFKEGLEDMVVGEQRRLWLPEDHAYGIRHDRPRGALTMDVELLAIEPPAIPTPSDLNAPPADAIRTSTGLTYKILRPGTGADHPFPQSTVTIDYNGWTADGDLFDSSVLRKTPVEGRVDRFMPGFTEALRLMTIGEKRRLWIPEALAYFGVSPPYEVLIFDVELLDFKRGAIIIGGPGTITIVTNMPNVAYSVVRPDGTMFGWRGPKTFIDQPAGEYGIIPDDVHEWTSTIAAVPADLILQGGQTLTFTLEYKKKKP